MGVCGQHLFMMSGKLSPIIKWAGGKEKELHYILNYAPLQYRDYYEPFVGGGSVYMAAEANHYFINDLSSELISLYRYIQTQDKIFFNLVEEIDNSWVSATHYYLAAQDFFQRLYIKYRTNSIDSSVLKQEIGSYCEETKDGIKKILRNVIGSNNVLYEELLSNLYRKMCRMKKIEQQKHELPPKDLYENIETAIKSAVYMSLRHQYNDKSNTFSKQLQCALFFFIRNYAYSGMFRYNQKGDFNVPYGGIAYNSKQLKNKIDYYQEEAVISHLQKTNISELDFENFFNMYEPKKEDFMFLDPPYDSEFSTYAQNEFLRADHERLANYLINRLECKWMLVIKATPFISSLYSNKRGINIMSFDKNYQVSFMNRNNKSVTHLLIKNY